MHLKIDVGRHNFCYDSRYTLFGGTIHRRLVATSSSQYDDNLFSILAKGRTPFNLSTLEATFIKILQPEFCRQKEFVYTLKLRH